MTDLNTEKNPEKEKAPQPEAQPAEAQAAPADEKAAAQPEAPSAEQKLAAELEQLKKELAAEKDQNLRIRAEYDNYRKRTAREMGEITADVRSKTVKEILPIADNIERALAAQEGSEAELRKGIAMVQQQIHNVFTQMHIEPIDAENIPFDPQLHNAVMHIEDENLGENMVVQVLQKGYKLGDKVLRYAMVKVAN